MKNRDYPIECDSTDDMLLSIQQSNIRLEQESDLQEDLSILSRGYPVKNMGPNYQLRPQI